VHRCEADEAFVDKFLEAKIKAHAVREAAAGPPPPVHCVVALARAAVARGLPVAIGTSGLRQHVEAHLKHCGLDDLFNSDKNNIVCAADVPRGKPYPDIYIEAARRIKVDPSRCRAYEDGESGLVAAHRAGCHAIDVTWMDEYPAVAGLRVVKTRDEAKRSW